MTGHLRTTGVMTLAEQYAEAWGNLMRLVSRRGFVVDDEEGAACRGRLTAAARGEGREGVVEDILMTLGGEIAAGATRDTAPGTRSASLVIAAIVGGSFNVAAWRSLLAKYEEVVAADAENSLLIFSTGSPTPRTRGEMRDSPVEVEIFCLDTLLFDLCSDRDVPRTRLVTERAEYDAIVARYGDTSKYPRLLAGDPVARHFNYRPGNLVVVTRTFPGLSPETLVRVVV